MKGKKITLIIGTYGDIKNHVKEDVSIARTGTGQYSIDISSLEFKNKPKIKIYVNHLYDKCIFHSDSVLPCFFEITYYKATFDFFLNTFKPVFLPCNIEDEIVVEIEEQ